MLELEEGSHLVEEDNNCQGIGDTIVPFLAAHSDMHIDTTILWKKFHVSYDTLD